VAPAPGPALASHAATAQRLITPRTYWVSETAGALDIPGTPSLECQRRIWWLAKRMRSYAGIREVVPGMNNLTVELDAAAPAVDDLLEALRTGWHESDAVSVSSRRIDIPVLYGGAAGCDLDEVARHAGLSAAEVIRLHCSAEYTVYFLGFQPGFAYLGGMDPRLATPRRREPRVAVAAGSVGIGGQQTGVYPMVSPGGWQLIGRTSLSLFDPAREPPSLLLPGDTVRFVDVREDP
jgi:KipI family sensor histidine kinase inhibitor